jgi:hypothetical protein
MLSSVKEVKEIKEISSNLSMENKKYVIAVANALLFSQGQAIPSNKVFEECDKPKITR